MRKFDLELSVGIFILVGILCLGYLSIRLAQLDLLGKEEYEVYAIFSDIGGLNNGASVVIAGVKVGKVISIMIEDYEAKVVMTMRKDIEIQEDAIASIKTRGIIGEKFIQISPGGAEEIVQPGGRIRETEPALDVEQLVSKYVFGKL